MLYFPNACLIVEPIIAITAFSFSNFISVLVGCIFISIKFVGISKLMKYDGI